MYQFPLIYRLTLALSALALIALASIGSALWLAEQIEGDATAVNVAGSLRMTAYRILALERAPVDPSEGPTANDDPARVWRDDFAHRLTSPALRDAIPSHPNHPVQQAMVRVTAAWETSPLNRHGSTTNAEADDLVVTVDALVTALEQDSARKLAALRWVERGFVVLSTLIIALVGLWVWRRLALPLSALTRQAERLRNHDWAARTALKGDDELATLSQSLDNMAREQARSYAEMQQQIDARTQSLLQEQSRIAVLNERSSIARELHDSLAQALTYQKIQLSLLQNQLTNTTADRAWQPIVNRLRNSVNEAYRQLRELLVTFRLQMTHGNLDAALQETVRELQSGSPNQPPLAVTVRGRFAGLPLAGETEVHVLHIIREALRNVHRHAQATQAAVDIDVSGQTVTVTISDNGIGLPVNAEKQQHFGLQILRERTQLIDGQLRIDCSADGTKLVLRFSLPKEES